MNVLAKHVLTGAEPPPKPRPMTSAACCCIDWIVGCITTTGRAGAWAFAFACRCGTDGAHCEIPSCDPGAIAARCCAAPPSVGAAAAFRWGFG